MPVPGGPWMNKWASCILETTPVASSSMEACPASKGDPALCLLMRGRARLSRLLTAA